MAAVEAVEAVEAVDPIWHVGVDGPMAVCHALEKHKLYFSC